MNSDSEKHRSLARAARPSGQDDADEEIAAAFEALRADPPQAEALRKERDFDRMIADLMRHDEPPAGLEESLIETLRECRSAGDPGPSVVPMTRRRWLGLGFGMAAAGALSVGGILAWRRSQQLPFETLARRLADISRKGVTLSLMSMDRDEVVSWLTTRKAPRAGTLPGPLDGLPRKGCHLYEIGKHEVSLECFLLPGMRELHLFTTPAAGLSGEPDEGNPVAYSRISGLTSASWTRGRQTMVMISEVPEEELRKVLV